MPQPGIEGSDDSAIDAVPEEDAGSQGPLARDVIEPVDGTREEEPGPSADPDPEPPSAEPAPSAEPSPSDTAESELAGAPDVLASPPEPADEPEDVPAPPAEEAPRAGRIIAIANQKGGVGKSTTAVNLGAALAETGRKILVVDLDPQGNASTGLGIEPARREIGTYQVVSTGVPASTAILETEVPNLWVIPSTIDLAGAEIELVGQLSREMRLARALQEIADRYDFILLDCPPSLGLLTVNALSAADELIVPIQCEYYALEGLGQLLRNVRLIQQNLNQHLSLTGIVLTMYDSRTKLSEQVVAEVKRYFGARVYDTIVPRTIRLSEAPGFGRPITEYDSKSRGADAYRRLASEVLEREASDAPLPEEEPPAVVGVRSEGGESE